MLIEKLTTLLGERTERIRPIYIPIFVGLHGLHSIKLVTRIGLVGVELKIYTFREVVFIDGHTLEIVRSANGNSHLSIRRLTKVDIVYARTHVNHAVCVSPAIFLIANINSLRVDIQGLLKELLLPRLAAILRCL